MTRTTEAAPYATSELLATLRRRAECLTGNHADADDLVQSAMVRALKYVGQDREIENWPGYLSRVVGNLAADRHGRRKRRGPHVDIDDVQGLLPVQGNQYHRWRLRELWSAIEALPPQQRAVIELIGVAGVTYQDAADQLGVPLGTVMSRLHRARETLRRRLEEDIDTAPVARPGPRNAAAAGLAV